MLHLSLFLMLALTYAVSRPPREGGNAPHCRQYRPGQMIMMTLSLHSRAQGLHMTPRKQKRARRTLMNDPKMTSQRPVSLRMNLLRTLVRTCPPLHKRVGDSNS